jgi:DNA repair protein RadA/Sms
MAVIGEVGLSGEVRTVSHTSSRLKEATRLGFKRCLLPSSLRGNGDLPTDGIEIVPVRSVAEAVEKALV